ncbi:uroplakin-3b [Rhinichthys klamathensis goyatoka]|uniref:uroplakin-3b n=1 Tax=Rhinichthys klamathensis goyatoka TaxID=3034132 RepID=UPI0024B59654|nr:uroplakin-3b [Rhinichthys klamathensis goyatoka]
MNTNAVIRLISLLSIWMWTGQGQGSFQPQLSPDLQGKITSNTVILKEPHCVFGNPCDGCDIWLVAALTPAISTFDTQFATSPSDILSMSPYPTAFGQSTSKNFFVTRVGAAHFPCEDPPNVNDVYFLVGNEGKCSEPNCNGILPDGSNVSFKYLLIDVNNQNAVVKSSNWSESFPLKTIQNPQSINDGLSARSGAMVVITTILCVAAALLLLLFFIMLCVACCGRKDQLGQGQGTTPMRVMNSIRIPRYDIHSLRGRAHPYDNPGYVSDVKNYSTSETLPKSGIQTQKL